MLAVAMEISSRNEHYLAALLGDLQSSLLIEKLDGRALLSHTYKCSQCFSTVAVLGGIAVAVWPHLPLWGNQLSATGVTQASLIL